MAAQEEKMNKYSEHSERALSSCHKDLRRIFEVVLQDFDHTIVEGWRSPERQRQLFAAGKTKIDGVNRLSKHNYWPSMAVDVAPYPVAWADRERFHFFAGFVLGVGYSLFDEGEVEHLIRWGGDWDQDTEVSDNEFDDLPHFELVRP
jgi:peptidoglycan L-alanyl-D-glutamate endopeptidase CwlK